MIEVRVRRIEGVISTDDIIPARYKHSFTDPSDMAPHVFEHRVPDLAASLHLGDALVGDSVFGIGSSREQAVSALHAAGVRAVLAPAFGRIFFRNCWNLGLPAIELDASQFLERSLIGIDLEAGLVICGDNRLGFPRPPQFMLDMAAAGGLLSVIKKREVLG
ncbi:hypothetical protein [Kocuria palustris]|uniref:LeuD/DmdB family oxidoreductase small subunit n=1 Tax=Kocuria palustris TaxID=71999 RepID=UPI00332B98F0